jgi:hypothetical protein
MKTPPHEIEMRFELVRQSTGPRRSLRLLLAGTLGILIAACPRGLDGEVSAMGTSAVGRECRKIVLHGEVAAGKEWRAVVGEGWVFRVIPIVAPSLRSDRTVINEHSGSKHSGSVPPDRGYTGWDLVMDRENGDGYPDALLLATPPYGSVNEREIGTTFGMRAQDAIAWEPRKFHFFTKVDRVQAARALYREIFAGVHKGPGTDASDAAVSQEAESASIKLLDLISSDPEMGLGQFSITDARLVSGSGNPPPYANAWLAHLSQVPHTLEQASPEDLRHHGEFLSELGELRSIQFVVTLRFPRMWKVPAGTHTETANCAE